MARLFILFLIALLPLRGWTAQGMVFAAHHTPAAPSASQALHGAMPSDCALHMHGAADQHEPAASSAPDHKTCESCQLCMPLAALDLPRVLAMAAKAQTRPDARSSRFVSADLAQGVKPPIS